MMTGRNPDAASETVNGESLLRLLGITDAEEAELVRASEAVEVVRMYCWAYTRGNGFFFEDQPCRALASVIHSGAARMYSNPEQDKQQTVGSVTISPGVMAGFNLAELAVLNRYRRRAL